MNQSIEDHQRLVDRLNLSYYRLQRRPNLRREVDEQKWVSFHLLVKTEKERNMAGGTGLSGSPS